MNTDYLLLITQEEADEEQQKLYRLKHIIHIFSNLEKLHFTKTIPQKLSWVLSKHPKWENMLLSGTFPIKLTRLQDARCKLGKTNNNNNFLIFKNKLSYFSRCKLGKTKNNDKSDFLTASNISGCTEGLAGWQTQIQWEAFCQIFKTKFQT